MKCKNCGGELCFENGVAICKTCGTEYKTDHVFEDIDVNICYIESDSNGRRTKDSIIAQELYHKLKSKKINAFYERISADGVFGDDLEQLRYSSIYAAKAVLVVGTSTENFNAIWDKYGKCFSDKVVIPFISDIKPSEIPKELSKIQALDYSSIGWEKDLEKGILRILGREKELELSDVYSKRKRLRFVLVILAVVIALVIAGVFLAVYYGETHENPEDTTTQETEVTLTNKQIYETAQELFDSGKYLEAIGYYSKIPDYKDSSNLIKKIYDRYDGYYMDEEQTSSLYINVIDGKAIEFSFEKTVDNKVLKIEDSLLLENNKISGRYVDNLSNEGEFSVTLGNEIIEMKVSTSVANIDVSLGNVEIQFKTKDKTDRPTMKTVTKEILLGWMSKMTYLEDIKSAGFELEHLAATNDYDFRHGTHYKIVNTDIKIITSDTYMSKYNEDDEKATSDIYVIAAIAPTRLVCPEKIGSSSCIYTENGLTFVPNAIDFEGDEIFTIESDSAIMEGGYMGITSKDLLGSRHDYLMTYHEEIYYRKVFITNCDVKCTGDVQVFAKAKTDNAVLICVIETAINPQTWYTESIKESFYRLDKSTYACEFISEFKKEDGYSFTGEYWKKLPELFGEFLPEELRAPTKVERPTNVDVRITSSDQINSDILWTLLDSEYTLEELEELGYDLELVDFAMDRARANELYRVKGTDIYFTMISLYNSDQISDNSRLNTENRVLLGIIAPAELIAPSYIGKACSPFFETDAVYWPNSFLGASGGFEFWPFDWVKTDYDDSAETVSEATMVGLSLRDSFSQSGWLCLME